MKLIWSIIFFSRAQVNARESVDYLFETQDEEVIYYANCGYYKMEQIYIFCGLKSYVDLLLFYRFEVEYNLYNSVNDIASITVQVTSG